MAETKGRSMSVTFTGSYQTLRSIYRDLSRRWQPFNGPDEVTQPPDCHRSEAGVAHKPSA